jgi:serine/threonine protein kinase
MIVMQYANRGSIRKLLNNSFISLGWKEKLDILRYIAYGLALIHKEGLMHKDFHSGNLVTTTLESNYYITDFGLCKPVGFQDSKIFGVLPYVAPEVLRGRNYTQASDIYSFGIIMTEVLTGYPPYHNIPHDEYLAIKICQGLRPKIRCEIPQLFLDMINRCLDAEPQKRPSAKKLYRILQKYSIDRNDSESEFSKQIDAIESSKKEFPIYDSTKPMATHSMAIYKSRMLDYKVLSKPVNITLEGNKIYLNIIIIYFFSVIIFII